MPGATRRNSAARARRSDAATRRWPPGAGYDRVAERIDEWVWTGFWKTHEAPLVHAWIDALQARFACDLGCGTGAYLRRLAGSVHVTVGIDISAGMLRQAQRALSGTCLVRAGIEQLPLAGARFEALLCTRTLSHVADPGAAAREMGRVAAPGARLLLTDVHPDHPYEHTRVAVGSEAVSIDTHHHSLAAVTSELERAGFVEVRVAEWKRSQLEVPPDRTLFPKLYGGADPYVFYVVNALRARSS